MDNFVGRCHWWAIQPCFTQAHKAVASKDHVVEDVDAEQCTGIACFAGQPDVVR